MLAPRSTSGWVRRSVVGPTNSAAAPCLRATRTRRSGRRCVRWLLTVPTGLAEAEAERSGGRTTPPCRRLPMGTPPFRPVAMGASSEKSGTGKGSRRQSSMWQLTRIRQAARSRSRMPLQLMTPLRRGSSSSSSRGAPGCHRRPPCSPVARGRPERKCSTSLVVCVVQLEIIAPLGSSVERRLQYLENLSCFDTNFAFATRAQTITFLQGTITFLQFGVIS